MRDATWIAGCARCRSHLLSMCADQGFEPRIGYKSEDMVVMQALVSAGLGVATSPGLALRAHRIDGIVASEIPGSHQHIYAATYGEPPDPPATTAPPGRTCRSRTRGGEHVLAPSRLRPRVVLQQRDAVPMRRSSCSDGWTASSTGPAARRSCRTTHGCRRTGWRRNTADTRTRRRGRSAVWS